MILALVHEERSQYLVKIHFILPRQKALESQKLKSNWEKKFFLVY